MDTLKLFLVKRYDDVDYDEHDSIVIVARDERDARYTHPDGTGRWDEKRGGWYDGEDGKDEAWRSWPCSPADLTVEEIGVAAPGRERGVVLASFNAG